MNITEAEFARAADALQTSTFTLPALALLDRLADQGGAQQLISEIVARQRASGATEEQAIAQTNRLLEPLGSVSKPIAFILMAHVYPIAATRMMHDVCNSIDLWMAHFVSDRLTRYLTLIAQSEQDARMRRHYQEWLRSQI
jgi:hypothetical protein